MKVKIFRGSDASIIEMNINNWLAQMATGETIDLVNQSESMILNASGESISQLTVSIFYH